MTDSILIQHGTVISMDPGLGIMRDCDILIEGNTIVKVSPNITAPDSSTTRIIDATNCLVSPGYVDCHHHLWQQLLRSVGSDWSLMDYALIMRTCFGSLYTADDVYTANYAGAVDLLHNGITTVVDHCHILNSPSHADAAVRALKHARIRGAFCYGLYANPPLNTTHHPDAAAINTADPAFTPAARRADLRRVLAQHFAGASGSASNTWESRLLVCGLATNEPETAGAAGIAAEIAFARSADLRLPLITSHVAIGHYDISRAQVVQHLGDADQLGPDLLFSHGAAWTDAECALLARSGAGVVSTPETELQMGMGHPVAFRLVDDEPFGCKKVGLGVDVTCSQNNDMVAQARLLLQAQRARDSEEGFKKGKKPPLKCPRKAVDVLRLATQGGADALGVGHLVGSLTPGKRADVVVTACDGLGMVPAVDPVGMLVCNSNASDIRTVLVDGRVVKDEGKLVGVDWEALREDVRKRSERLVRASQVIVPELMKGISKEEDDFEETVKKLTEALAMGAKGNL
ncbi:5-methylthioadenosine/S-adenosylhomocysteine deaminase [Lasiodiplodia theobromae]|uniref:5-methylthioadenosine/S-adenosylhomocysteine deaminase n=1 Tax=Lasiodiplodia theobromae TaxID=45133 RepID=A0A5N5D1T4_9PEZI|nr:5-methylthioadenosine/S-adenosylhomocysteine deaminase [Lasiodiplodia theobromae]